MPASARAWTAIGDVSDPTGARFPIRLDLAGRDLLTACQTHPATEYLVIEANGRGVGVLAMADLRAALLDTGRPQAASA